MYDVLIGKKKKIGWISIEKYWIIYILIWHVILWINIEIYALDTCPYISLSIALNLTLCISNSSPESIYSISVQQY